MTTSCHGILFRSTGAAASVPRVVPERPVSLRASLVRFGSFILPLLSFRPLSFALSLLLLASSAQAARIKDICSIEGVRDNQLIGYGLVVGLNGTGDGSGDDMGLQTLVTFLKRNNIQMDIKKVKPKNVAAVVVTATLPPFAHQGTRLDVTVSSIGDAADLHGGTLLAAPLRPVTADPSAPGSVYGVAQGPVSTGGFSSGTGGGGATAAVVKNHPTTGAIPNGAIVEREVETAFATKPEAVLQLRNPDFTTADRIAQIINATFGSSIAKAHDSASVAVTMPAGGDTEARVQFLSQVENLQVSPNVPARVVFNERTGTIVMGGDVRITSAIITHGNLTVETKTATTAAVAQQAGALGGGQQLAVQTATAEVKVKEEPGEFRVIDEGVTIGEVAKALNALGVSARDIISVLQALKECGALQAELVAM